MLGPISGKRRQGDQQTQRLDDLSERDGAHAMEPSTVSK